MNDVQIKHMVDRFLGWKLPENFNPDGGISFQKMHSHQGLAGPQKYEPSGTNVFDAEQADAMVRYMVEDLPAPTPPAPTDEQVERDRLAVKLELAKDIERVGANHKKHGPHLLQ